METMLCACMKFRGGDERVISELKKLGCEVRQVGRRQTVSSSERGGVKTSTLAQVRTVRPTSPSPADLLVRHNLQQNFCYYNVEEQSGEQSPQKAIGESPAKTEVSLSPEKQSYNEESTDETYRRKRSENTVYVHDHLISWDAVQAQKQLKIPGYGNANNSRNSGKQGNSSMRSAGKLSYMEHTRSSQRKIKNFDINE